MIYKLTTTVKEAGKDERQPSKSVRAQGKSKTDGSSER
jgi:hypothetical protein